MRASTTGPPIASSWSARTGSRTCARPTGSRSRRRRSPSPSPTRSSPPWSPACARPRRPAPTSPRSRPRSPSACGTTCAPPGCSSVQRMAEDTTNASEQIDKRVGELGDWRGETLAKVRAIIREADPDVVEEWKWAKATSPGTPVWSHNGGICTGESYKSVVKLTFFKGASLSDPSGLFNSSLEGKVRRAIDIKETDTIDENALKDLIREAVALNLGNK